MTRLRCAAADLLEHSALVLAVAAATTKATARATVRAADSIRPSPAWALSDHPDVMDLDASA